MFGSLYRPAGAGCTVAAPAKVNLHLELLGKRPDGYHDLDTLIACVNLFDTLEIQPARGLSLSCDSPGVPTDSRNLVLKAAEALRAAAGTPFGATIRLTKRIPHEAGLGGGSSDAAATLYALNRIWKLDLSAKELQTIGAAVGSDVPAFLAGATSRCTGRGEVAEPADLGETLHLVIVKPAVGLSTAAVYKSATVPAGPRPFPSRGSDGWPLFNRLQPAAFALQPVAERVYARLRECGPLGVLLSGSGSAVFAVCRSGPDARRVAVRYREAADPADRVFAVRTI